MHPIERRGNCPSPFSAVAHAPCVSGARLLLKLPGHMPVYAQLTARLPELSQNLAGPADPPAVHSPAAPCASPEQLFAKM